MFLVGNYRLELGDAVVVHDKHPEYPSTGFALSYAKRFGVKAFAVQHYYTHVLATLADQGIVLEDKVIGLAIDGIGYGDDGAVWDDEVLEIEGSREFAECLFNHAKLLVKDVVALNYIPRAKELLNEQKEA